MRLAPLATAVRGIALSCGAMATTLVACSSGGRDTPPPSPDSSVGAPPATVPVLPAQLPAMAPRPGATVARIAVRRDTTTFGIGPAVVTLTSGDTLTVSDSAVRAWSFGGGSMVAVSGLDGAGGYENEGQSLTVIDVTTGARRRVVSDYFQIIRVERAAAAGQEALLVHMRDGGQGSLHVTVVDPRRGPVFRTRNAIGRAVGDRVIVAGFGDSETPVDFGDKRTPIRVDTITVSGVGALPLLVVPGRRRRDAGAVIHRVSHRVM